MGERVELDRFRERVEVETREGKVVGRGLEPVYVVARDRRRGQQWARQNKPSQVPKVFSTMSEIGPRGLRIRDVPVYVLDPMPQDIRDSWLRTGGRLIYL